MKLLILVSYHYPEINAQSVRISQIARRLCQLDEDIRIRVAAFNPIYKNSLEVSDQEMSSERSVEAIRYKRILLPPSFFIPQSLNPLTIAVWTYIAMKEMRGFKPDLVMATTPPFASGIGLYLACKIRREKSPYIVDYRDDLAAVIDQIASDKAFPLRHMLRASNRIISKLLDIGIKNAAIVTTVNGALQRKLLNLNKKIIIVPNGLDLQELNRVMLDLKRDDILIRNGISNLNSKFIIFLGDLDMPYYIPEIILEPLRRLRSKGRNLKYIIIGDGAGRGRLEAQIKDLGLQDSVYLVGRKSHEEALRLLLASHMALYPLQKGYPQAKHAIAAKIFEYVGCRLPILAVADEGSAISEFISTEEIGISLSWGELNKLEIALESLLDSSKYIESLDANYSRFMEDFDRNRGIDLLYLNMKRLANIRAD